MKKQILILAVLLLITATDSFSQYGLSKGKVNATIDTNFWKGRNTSFSAATTNCGTVHTAAYTGTIICNLGGVANVPFYCLDLCTNINLSDSIKDSASTIQQAIYITNNYYPAKTGYPGQLPKIKDEACAIQMAIWHFRNAMIIDSVNIDGVTNDPEIRTRAKTIINETIANSGNAVQVSTIEIHPGVNPDDFYVRTLDTNGNPIAVNNIQVSITGGGTLSTATVNTDISGNSPDVIVTGANNGSIIQATGLVTIPRGTTYCGLNAIKQLLVLGYNEIGLRSAFTSWGALPVELRSFTALVTNSSVSLSWNTVSETNNSGFDIERKSVDSEQWKKIGYAQGHGNTNISYEYNFVDFNVASGKYNYRLKQIDFNGNYEYHNLTSNVNVGTPDKFNLSQNYPNPFNPSTTINFDMPTDGYVSLKVYNTSGKEVADLVNETRSAGYHTIVFNAAALSSGVYYYRLESNGVSKVMKMALIK
ncbi:MAG: T9SS type A sorting domain-containing protein [Ignavibacteriae bacterium]|nr:T9SS type A sorting domain-containing protein [Ignavibacteriota bacterium]